MIMIIIHSPTQLLLLPRVVLTKDFWEPSTRDTSPSKSVNFQHNNSLLHIHAGLYCTRKNAAAILYHRMDYTNITLKGRSESFKITRQRFTDLVLFMLQTFRMLHKSNSSDVSIKYVPTSSLNFSNC